MKKIFVLSLIPLIGFVAFIYTKQVYADDYISLNGNVGVTHFIEDGIPGTTWSDPTGMDHFRYNYSDGGSIEGTIWKDSSGTTRFSSNASYLNGGLMTGTIDSGGDLHFDPSE